MITLDGRLQSNLDWKAAREEALEVIAQGNTILWNIDLGLFRDLKHPLSHQSQYLSLTLSLKHFTETLWPEFQGQTRGLCLYTGNLDFSRDLPWNNEHLDNLQGWLEECFGDVSQLEEETGIAVGDFKAIKTELLHDHFLFSLFCRDAAVDYLCLLAASLPDGLPIYLNLATPKKINLWLEANLRNPDCYDRFQLLLDGGEAKTPRLKPSIAICLPSHQMRRPSQHDGIQEAMLALNERNVSFGVTPESRLTTEWDGLDYLIVTSKGVSFQGRRKLQGFCAAGGTVLTLGEPIGLEHEFAFGQWLSTR